MAKSYCEHERIRGNCAACSPEQVFRQYQYKAKQRNFSFMLTLDEFEKITQSACVFCGEQPALGVDRKDSRIGYNFRNSQACCGLCNRWKSAMIEHHFLFHASKIAKYQELRKQKAA
jgi:hypothetical protein